MSYKYMLNVIVYFRIVYNCIGHKLVTRYYASVLTGGLISNVEGQNKIVEESGCINY